MSIICTRLSAFYKSGENMEVSDSPDVTKFISTLRPCLNSFTEEQAIPVLQYCLEAYGYDLNPCKHKHAKQPEQYLNRTIHWLCHRSKKTEGLFRKEIAMIFNEYIHLLEPIIKSYLRDKKESATSYAKKLSEGSKLDELGLLLGAIANRTHVSVMLNGGEWWSTRATGGPEQGDILLAFMGFDSFVGIHKHGTLSPSTSESECEKKNVDEKVTQRKTYSLRRGNRHRESDIPLSGVGLKNYLYVKSREDNTGVMTKQKKEKQKVDVTVVTRGENSTSDNKEDIETNQNEQKLVEENDGVTEQVIETNQNEQKLVEENDGVTEQVIENNENEQKLVEENDGVREQVIETECQVPSSKSIEENNEEGEKQENNEAGEKKENVQIEHDSVEEKQKNVKTKQKKEKKSRGEQITKVKKKKITHRGQLKRTKKVNDSDEVEIKKKKHETQDTPNKETSRRQKSRKCKSAGRSLVKRALGVKRTPTKKKTTRRSQRSQRVIEVDTVDKNNDEAVNEEPEPSVSNTGNVIENVDNIHTEVMEVGTNDVKRVIKDEVKTNVKDEKKSIFSIKEHVLKKRKARRYRCVECSLLFDKVKERTAHMHRDHKVGKYKCAICNKMFLSEVGMEKHYARHTNKGDYTCEICNQKYTFKSELDRHKMKHDKSAGRHQCPAKSCIEAGKGLYKHASDLARHFKTHEEEGNFTCEECGKVKKTQKQLYDHIYRCHMKYLKCEKCDFSTKDKDKLNKHMCDDEDENEIVLYDCQYSCGYRSEKENEMEDHEVTCTKNPKKKGAKHHLNCEYVLSGCDFHCTSKREMTKHQKKCNFKDNTGEEMEMDKDNEKCENEDKKDKGKGKGNGKSGGKGGRKKSSRKV